MHLPLSIHTMRIHQAHSRSGEGRRQNNMIWLASSLNISCTNPMASRRQGLFLVVGMVARCWKKQGCGGHRKDLVTVPGVACGNGEI
jgi:hypothetical protein